MLRPSLTKPTITCNRKCLFQRPQYSSVTSRKKFATNLAADIKNADEEPQDGYSAELPTNPLYTKEVSELLVASRDKTARRVWGLTSTNFNPWEKFIAVWQNLVAIRRALLVREGSLSPDADPLSFPNLHTYFVNHKRFLATKIMRSKLPPQYRAFVLNWDIQNRTKLRDEHMLEFLYQKYPDCFPKGYIEKIVTTYSTSRTDSASSRELLVGQIPKWIERMGVLKSLDWNRERTIALMAYSARTDDVKLFTELLNDFMAHETNPASAWKGIKDILASETSEQTLKDLYEAALSAKMVTPDLTWGIVLGLNRFKNTKAILDLMQKAVKSDPEVIAPQAFDVAVQALVNEGDIENAYALFILRPDQTEENYHGYKKTRTMLLLEMSKQGYTKRMLELYEKSWQGAVPPDSFGLQTLLTYFIEVRNDQLVEYFWNQFKQRNLVVGPICYNLMAKHYLQKNEPEKVKEIAEELRDTSEEGSRSRMVFGTARISHALHQGNFDEALSLYHKMANPDAAVYSKIIPGLLKEGRVEEAKIEIDRLKAKVQQEEKNQESILKKAEAINVVAHYNLMKHQSIAEIFTRPITEEEKDEEED